MQTLAPRDRSTSTVQLSLAGSKVTALEPLHLRGMSKPPRNTSNGNPQGVYLNKADFAVLPEIKMAPFHVKISPEAATCMSEIQDSQIVVLSSRDQHLAETVVNGIGNVSIHREVSDSLTCSTLKTDVIESPVAEEGEVTVKLNHSSSCTDLESSISNKHGQKEKKKKKRKKSKQHKRSKSSMKHSANRRKTNKSKPVSLSTENTNDLKSAQHIEGMNPLQSQSIKVLAPNYKPQTSKTKIIYPELLKRSTSDNNRSHMNYSVNASLRASNALEKVSVLAACYNSQSQMRSQTMDILQYYANQNHRASDSIVHTQSKQTKVYLSEKQSRNQREMGQEYPCPPPATPMPAFLDHYEYVPCMSDIKSQRVVKARLEALHKVEKRRLDKLKEEKHNQHKAKLKEQEVDLRKQQRLEIYALNKVMTELEYANFLAFCTKHGLKNAQ